MVNVCNNLNSTLRETRLRFVLVTLCVLGATQGNVPNGAIRILQTCHLQNVAIKQHYLLMTESRCIPSTVIGRFC